MKQSKISSEHFQPSVLSFPNSGLHWCYNHLTCQHFQQNGCQNTMLWSLSACTDKLPQCVLWHDCWVRWGVWKRSLPFKRGWRTVLHSHYWQLCKPILWHCMGANSDGKLLSLFDAIPTETCSDGCSRGLQQASNELGCCVDAVYNNTFVSEYLPFAEYSLWSKCGVVTPGVCSSASALSMGVYVLTVTFILGTTLFY